MSRKTNIARKRTDQITRTPVKMRLDFDATLKRQVVVRYSVPIYLLYNSFPSRIYYYVMHFVVLYFYKIYTKHIKLTLINN